MWCIPAQGNVRFVCQPVLFYAPFVNWCRIQVADNHAACEWAEGYAALQGDYADAKHVTLVRLK